MTLCHVAALVAAISGALECNDEGHFTPMIVPPFRIMLLLKDIAAHRGLTPRLG